MKPEAPVRRGARVARAVAFAGAFALPAAAATLADKSRESGCVNKPQVVSGTLYRCKTEAGTESYFNVPNASPDALREAPERRTSAAPSAVPRVDPATQKTRDEKRRQLLTGELAAEEKLLAEARIAYAGGAPPAQPEERNDAEKYRERIAKLRQSVAIHEKNIEALRKELAAVR